MSSSKNCVLLVLALNPSSCLLLEGNGLIGLRVEERGHGFTFNKQNEVAVPLLWVTSLFLEGKIFF